MKRKTLRFGKGFRVAISKRGSQAAEMVLVPGKSEGDSGNKHVGADQWLFVVEGRGQARVNGRKHDLRKGSLLLVERGDRHEIRALGKTPLRTLNVYVPCAYSKNGDPLPRGRRR